jgi:hypothetical protein
MAVLKDKRETKTIQLASVEGGEVVMYDTPLVGDMVDISFGEDQVLSTEDSLKIMVRLIQSWNLTNEAGEPLPVTLENLKLFSIDDFSRMSVIFKNLEAIAPDQKKS